MIVITNSLRLSARSHDTIIIVIIKLEFHRANCTKAKPIMQSPIGKDEGLIGMLLQIGTFGGIPLENSYCIGVSGNYLASSE